MEQTDSGDNDNQRGIEVSVATTVEQKDSIPDYTSTVKTREKQANEISKKILALPIPSVITLKTKNPDFSDSEIVAEVISRAGKNNRKHRNWRNIEYIETEDLKSSWHGINFDDVDTWSEVETPDDDHSGSTEDKNTMLFSCTKMAVNPVTRILVALPRSWKNMETHGRITKTHGKT